ncbi:MAG: hypothetical protein HYW34_00220 [Candidatus Brennerbacteria bacterium]|nr:hypothetical protein [Candidatus Brennerbacteria bacterium]
MPYLFSGNNIFLKLMQIRQLVFGFWESYGIAVQAFSVLLSGALLFGIVFFILRLGILNYQAERFIDVSGFGDLSRRRSLKAWQQIQKRMRLGGEANMKLALIEADKIFDEIIKLSGYKGETMADRLKQITPAQLSGIERLWQAHKIRNRVVHEPDFHLTLEQTDAALDIYKQSFQEMGLID